MSISKSTKLTKRIEKKGDGNYTRMLRAILNKSGRKHPTKHQLYGHLLSKVRRTRHAGYWWRSRDDLISDFRLWNSSHGRAKVGQPARTYIQQLWEDTVCSLEDLQEAMNDREEWRERVRDIRAGGTTWWWWVISWLNYLTLDFELWITSAQYLVCLVVEAISDSSLILHIHHAATHSF